MKIVPVAFDSMGARSMATYVETNDVKIFIDPGVSISPDRYSLPPHRIEIDRHRKLWDDIKKWVACSDIVVITHYHYDHHNPNEPEIYRNKDIFIKNPHQYINESQKNRAAFFLTQIEGIPRSITIADSTSFTFGKTKLLFSKPVFHGLSNRLGYVILVTVEEYSRFLFSSDIQGPLDNEAVEIIINIQPDILFLDGPSTYLLGSYYKKNDIDCAAGYINKIITNTKVKNLIIDHHLLRDLNYCEFMNKINSANTNSIIQSAARYRGIEEEPLEAMRKDFHEGKLPVVNNYG